MKKTQALVLLIIIFSIFNGNSQSDSTLVIFDITFGKKAVDLTTTDFGPTQPDSLVIEKVRFYISDIILLFNADTVFMETNSHHLIDASDRESRSVVLEHATGIRYNNIQYKLGIDSLTNSSGILTGDLDPTKGMYWTWQSGYVNFKLEGTSSKCTAKNNNFQFHLGGYLFPNLAIQTISLNCKQSNIIPINLNLKKVIESIDLSSENTIRSPSLEAVSISKKIASGFTITKAVR